MKTQALHQCSMRSGLWWRTPTAICREAAWALASRSGAPGHGLCRDRPSDPAGRDPALPFMPHPPQVSGFAEYSRRQSETSRGLAAVTGWRPARRSARSAVFRVMSNREAAKA